MLLILLDILFLWILMGVAVAILFWSGLNFAKICDWILNKITRRKLHKG